MVDETSDVAGDPFAAGNEAESTRPVRRRRGRNFWLAALAVALITAAVIWSRQAAPRDPYLSAGEFVQAPEVGYLAPNFTLETLDGPPIQLTDLRGKPVILNFWTTWCGPCRVEMPELERLWAEHNQGDVMVLGVNQGEDPATVAHFARGQVDTTFPILLDPQELLGDNLYDIRAYPTTFFVDAEGRIREIKVGGPLQMSTLRASVDALLAPSPQ